MTAALADLGWARANISNSPRETVSRESLNVDSGFVARLISPHYLLTFDGNSNCLTISVDGNKMEFLYARKKGPYLVFTEQTSAIGGALRPQQQPMAA